MEQENIGTMEEGRRKAKRLIASSWRDRSHPRIAADFDIGNKNMVGDSLREALKNMFIRAEFRIQGLTDSLRYVLLANFPYEEDL